MKIILFVFLTVFTFSIFAQNPAGGDSSAINTPQPVVVDVQPVKIAAVVIAMDTQQGQLVIKIPQATLKDVQKDWAKYVGTGSKGKAATADGQYSQYGAVNKSISPDPFNITAKILTTINGVSLAVWLSDNNNFQNAKDPNNDRDLALQKYVHDFAVAEYKQAVTYELDDEQGRLKSMQEQLTKMIKEEQKLTKRNEENNRSIIKTNDAILTNKRDIQSASAQIESQKAMVQTTAADPNAKKGAMKTLQELENDKKNLQKQNDKQGKYILSLNNEIKANDRAIAENIELQATQSINIEKQKQVINRVQGKFESIR